MTEAGDAAQRLAREGRSAVGRGVGCPPTTSMLALSAALVFGGGGCGQAPRSQTEKKADQEAKYVSERAAAHWRRGKDYAAVNEYDKARAAYSAAIELRPDYAEAYMERAGTYRDRGWHECALAYLDKGGHERDFTDLTRAIELKPDWAMAYVSRGVGYYDGRGDRARARADFETAVAVAPDSNSTFALYARAWLVGLGAGGKDTLPAPHGVGAGGVVRQYKDGKLHGKVVNWDSGRRKSAEMDFSDGRPDGVVRLWYRGGGLEAEFRWREGKRHGVSTRWHKNGKKAEKIRYVDGRLTGTRIEWDEKGNKLCEARYENGNAVEYFQYRDGDRVTGEELMREYEAKKRAQDEVEPEEGIEVREEYYPGGVLKRRWRVKISEAGTAVKHGKYEEWYDDGQKRVAGQYRDGRLHAKVIEWYSGGQRRSETGFSDGERDGVARVWYWKGFLREEASWKKGKLHGVHTKWHKNGKKRLEWNRYVDGRLTGTRIEWDENGNKK